MSDTLGKFLTDLKVGRSTQKKLEERQQLKETLLNKLRDERSEKNNTILAGSDLQMTRGKKGEKAVNMLDARTHDQTKTADLADQSLGYRLADASGNIEEGTQDQFQKHLATRKIVSGMVDKLSVMVPKLDSKGRKVDPYEEEPLFSDDEIAAEVFDPLLRIGLLAETFVPNEFSRTHRMLKGTFASYGKRVEEAEKSSNFGEYAALGKTVFISALTIAGGDIKLDAASKETGDELATGGKAGSTITTIQKHLGIIAIKDDEFSTAVAKTAQAMEFVSQGIAFLDEVVYEGQEDIREALEKEEPEEMGANKRRKQAAPKLARAIVAMVASELADIFAEADLSTEVSSAFGSLVKTQKIVTALSARQFTDKNVTDIVQALKAGVDETLQKLDPGDPVQAFKQVRQTFNLVVDAGAVTKALKAKTLDGAVILFGKAAEKSKDAAKKIADKDLDNLTDKEQGNYRTRVQTAAGKAMDEVFDRDDDEYDSDKPAKPKHTPKEDHQDPDWVWQDGPEGGWHCAFCAAQGDDPRIFAGIIDRKIAQLKRDAAILEWGSKLAAMSFEIASNFLAPLAIGGCALKMAKNITLAVKRWSDFEAFRSKRGSMFEAASAYSAAATRFVRNSELQGAHYTANAAAEGAKMIGAILQCSAVAAHAGVVVSSSANIAQAIEAVLYEMARLMEVKKAWKDYQEALYHPDNRRLGLLALESNSTLAKYAIAWGAVIEKDALVSDFLGACNLNADSLRDPGANVDKVVAYLEARLPDDQVIVGRKISLVSWIPKEIELTAISWVGAKALGEAKADLKPDETPGIDAGLSQLDASLTNWRKVGEDKAKGIPSEDLEACKRLINLLRAEFTKYKPRHPGEKKEFHVEMSEVRSEFTKKLELVSSETAKWTVLPPVASSAN